MNMEKWGNYHVICHIAPLEVEIRKAMLNFNQSRPKTSVSLHIFKECYQNTTEPINWLISIEKDTGQKTLHLRQDTSWIRDCAVTAKAVRVALVQLTSRLLRNNCNHFVYRSIEILYFFLCLMGEAIEIYERKCRETVIQILLP